MTITRCLLVSGLAAALGLGVACERRTNENQASKPSPEATTPPPAATPTPPSTPPSESSQAATRMNDEKQPVSGTSLTYVTDDGKKGEITNPDEVKQVQKKLAAEGLYSGEIDGRWSPELSAALRRFQARNQLPDNATIDHATANKLGLDWDQLTKANVRDQVEKGANDVKDEAKDVGKKVDESTKDVTKEINKDVNKANDQYKDQHKDQSNQ